MLELSLQQLQKLNTKRLLNYKKLVNKKALGGYYEDWVHYCSCHECMSIKEFKQKWSKVYDNIKAILKDREHIKLNKITKRR